MDRELAMALTTATADDDEKCPDDVMKRLVKLSGKQKDPAALEDLVATLAAKLQDGSFKVKLKTLRCTMMVLNDKRSGRLKDAIRGSACLDAVSALVEFTMEADPVHGDKPLDEPMVTPVVLTNSDVTERYWKGAASGQNDHEGVTAFAFVSETWVLMVAAKHDRC